MIAENWIWFYLIGGFITITIGSYRALNNKQSTESTALDSLSWFFVWFIYLPIFIVRYVKYKFRGKKL